jgi:ABC-2 type transport system permease protein
VAFLRHFLPGAAGQPEPFHLSAGRSLFLFIIPAITMRLFSEEINQGSYELLLTLPVTSGTSSWGNSWRQSLLSELCSARHSFMPSRLLSSGSDWGPVIGGYFGALLLAAAFTAVGLFASTLTRNQVVAFIIGMTICFSSHPVDQFPPLFSPGQPGGLLSILQCPVPL